MRVRPLSALPLILALSSLGFGQTVPKGLQKITSVEGITEYQMPSNGLKILLFPDQSKPKITVNMTYLVGSRQEGYGETGMAHLLEHLLFKETPTRKNIKQELVDRGADWNGSTFYDRTNYHETVTASDENLKWALELEADRMVNAIVTKAVLDPEMTVVRNEFERGENSPDRVLFQRTLEAAYSFHNYGKSTIGVLSDIENVSYDRLAAFYRKYYQPDNAVLTIAGQFDESKALAGAAEAFGKLPRPQRVLDKTYTVEPTQDGERFVALRRVGDVQAIMAVYHMPSGTHPDSAAIDVLTTVLGDTPSGRLYKALVDNKKTVSARMDSMTLHDPGVMIASARLRQDQSVDEARQLMLKTIEGLAQEPPTKEEVERAKTKLLKQIDLGLANSEEIGIEISEWASMGDWRLLFLNRDRIKNVTPEEVTRVAKAYLKESNRTLGVFYPTPKPDRAEIPATPEVAAVLKDYKGGEAAAQGEAFDPTPANIEARLVRSQLPNGMKVVLLPKKTRAGNVVALVNLRFGTAKDLMGTTPVAQLTGSMLMRGTKNRTRQQIQDEMDRLKARINIGGGPTGASATVETTEANLAGALKLVAEILREPSFPENELEQVRQQRIAGVESQKSEPQTQAMLVVRRHISPYPKGDVRYVQSPDEQVESLKAVTLDDIRKFYSRFYGASNSEFVVSGQFNAPEIQKLAAGLFGNWKSPSPYERVVSAHRTVEAINKNLETPDKKNAMMIAAYRFKMTDDDPDYPAIELASYMLGGSPASHIWKRIRDKEGLSYSTGTNVTVPTQEGGAVLIGYAISNPQNSPKVEASFKDEIARTSKEGFTAEEVAAAKKGLLEEQKVARSQDQALARMLSEQEYFGRTMMWDDAIEKKIAALTPDQVSEALRRHIDPAGLSYVKAGDFKTAGVFQN